MTIALIAASLVAVLLFIAYRLRAALLASRTPVVPQAESPEPIASVDSVAGDDPMATVRFHVDGLKARVPRSGGVDVRDRQARLVGISKGVSGLSIPLKATGAIIGRADDNQIQVDDPLVSQRHLWVGLVHGKAVVSDLNSTNGTYLNSTSGAPISDAELKPNDTVLLGGHGGTQFRFVAD